MTGLDIVTCMVVCKILFVEKVQILSDIYYEFCIYRVNILILEQKYMEDLIRWVINDTKYICCIMMLILPIFCCMVALNAIKMHL